MTIEDKKMKIAEDAKRYIMRLEQSQDIEMSVWYVNNNLSHVYMLMELSGKMTAQKALEIINTHAFCDKCQIKISKSFMDYQLFGFQELESAIRIFEIHENGEIRYPFYAKKDGKTIEVYNIIGKDSANYISKTEINNIYRKI